MSRYCFWRLQSYRDILTHLISFIVSTQEENQNHDWNLNPYAGLYVRLTLSGTGQRYRICTTQQRIQWSPVNPLLELILPHFVDINLLFSETFLYDVFFTLNKYFFLALFTVKYFLFTLISADWRKFIFERYLNLENVNFAQYFLFHFTSKNGFSEILGKFLIKSDFHRH